MSTRATRAKILAATAVAFTSGVVFASAADLTRFGWAQGRVNGSANKPTAAEVAPAADLESAFEAVADHARPAVVSIATERFQRERPAARGRRGGGGGNGQQLPPGIEDWLKGFDDPRAQQQSDQPEEASGSGFIVSPEGYILTNNHVVADADKVTVTLFDKSSYTAKVVGRDPSTDVAVIKIDGKNFPTVGLGDDAKMRVGQWVLAIGNPLDLDFTVTAGIVSAKGRNQSGLLRDRYAITDYIQTDAAINPGNSGGPLLNIRGDVIGINSAIASGTGFYNGYGFAIPITLAKQVMDDLIKYGSVKRAILGINLNEVDPAAAKAVGLTRAVGAKVVGFGDDSITSPAHKVGIELSDVVTRADGKDVDQVNTLQRIIRAHKPGDVVDIDVMRLGGDKKSFKIKLTEAPAAPVVATNDVGDTGARTRPTTNAPSAVRSMDKLGISVEPISSDFAREAKLNAAFRSGLRVAGVTGRGPAYHTLQENELILSVLSPVRRDIKSVDDLQSVVNDLKSGDVITLKVCFPNPNDGSCQTSAASIQVDK
ncbi:MAG TPA: trypsin-like peptidase domain-containing protein [Gemmatimonadaceae bacterium]|jgi:serine protease Do